MENASRRNTGIDLLRIVSMYMIVVLHIQGPGGILDTKEYFSAHYLLALLLQSATFCSVNCFGMITGYVMVNSGIKLKKLVLMWMQVFFYSFGIMLVAALVGHIDPDRVMWLRSIFPVFGKRYWYVTAYFGMMLLAPGAIYAVNHMPQKMLRNMLITIAAVVSLIGTLTRVDPFMYELGYSAAWLMFLFLLGGYLRRWGAFTGWSGKKLFGGFVALSAATAVFKQISNLPHYFYCPILENLNMLEFTSPTVLGASVMLFLYFERLQVTGKLAHWTKKLAPFAFGVYLVHVHHVTFRRLGGSLHSYRQLPVWGMALAVQFTAIAIYLLSTLIDWLRSLLFKALRLERLADWIAVRLTKTADWIGKICE